jgi:hypothetical protein
MLPSGRASRGRDVEPADGRIMLDLLFLTAGLGFFALAAGYVALCERF